MLRRFSVWLFAFALLAVPSRPFAVAPSALALLDDYAQGHFAAVVSSLDDLKDFDGLLKQLEQDGPGWIDAAGPDDHARRELTAATVALEAARVDEWREWKLVQHGAWPLDTLYWKPPPLLITWGAGLFLRSAAPKAPPPIERWWQLAAVAVAERAEDFEFLIGSPFENRSNPGDEIAYLTPLVARFPKEPRFVLAQAMAFEWRTWPGRRSRGGPAQGGAGAPGMKDAQQAFDALTKDDVVGGEAMVRLGELRLRTGAVDDALKLFDRAESATRDPYVIYLARFLKGQALERQKHPADAVWAYRGALAAVPRAQSASMALAAQLFLTDERAEAAAVLNANLSDGRQPVDPWRALADGDDRFWPELIARLRSAIVRPEAAR
jgi:hypothetical protein